MRIGRALLTVAAVASILFAAVPTHAQPYPSKLIRIVAPFPAGGPTDGAARLIADRLSAVLGQTIVIENRPGGAGGTVGVKSVASADPDGYTILFTPPGPLVAAPAIYRNVGYDPVKAFAPIAAIFSSPQILVANPAVPAKSMQELVAHAKANPGKVSYASPGLRHPAASAWRDAQADDGRRHRARAVQGLRAGARRPDRRPGADASSTPRRSCCRMLRAASSRCSRWPTRSALPATPRHADHGRGRLRQAPGDLLGRRAGARRDTPPADRRAAQCGDQRGDEIEGDGGNPRQAGRDRTAGLAAGFRCVHGGRDAGNGRRPSTPPISRRIERGPSRVDALAATYYMHASSSPRDRNVRFRPGLCRRPHQGSERLGIVRSRPARPAARRQVAHVARVPHGRPQAAHHRRCRRRRGHRCVRLGGRRRGRARRAGGAARSQRRARSRAARARSPTSASCRT